MFTNVNDVRDTVILPTATVVRRHSVDALFPSSPPPPPATVPDYDVVRVVRSATRYE